MATIANSSFGTEATSCNQYTNKAVQSSVDARINAKEKVEADLKRFEVCAAHACIIFVTLVSRSRFLPAHFCVVGAV